MSHLIIKLFKATAVIYVVLLLILFVGLGLFAMISGTTINDRMLGLGTIVGGVIFTLLTAGSFAIMFDNNRLLKVIAGEQSNSEAVSNDGRSSVRKEPIIER